MLRVELNNGERITPLMVLYKSHCVGNFLEPTNGQLISQVHQGCVNKYIFRIFARLRFETDAFLAEGICGA